MRTIINWLLAGSLWLLAGTAMAEDDPTRDQIKSLDEQVQDIKKDVINLNSELSRLEEKLLFPSNSQVAVFISMREGDQFRLDTLHIKLDNKVVAHHLYNFRELEAMQRGGVQKIYTGNLNTGDHELVVSYAGKAPGGGEYQRSASYTLSKEVGPKFVEVQIAGPGVAEQDITFKAW